MLGKPPVIFILLAFAAETIAAPKDHPSYAEALALAKDEAKSQGIDLSQYVLGPLSPGFHPRKPLGKWDFFFHCKGASPPGCFFDITVDRVTGAVQYHPGM